MTKLELKAMAEMVHESVTNESKHYGEDIDIYKNSVSYKKKSEIYAKVMSEYLGNEVKVNHESIFGLLDIE